MFKLILLIYIIVNNFLNISSQTIDLSDLLVSTPYGDIKGEERDYYIAFEGIPYAEPPINENRFEPAKKLTKKWNGVFDATKFGPVCMQWDHFDEDDDKTNGEEDCLYLNIYTKNPRPDNKYPVMIFIHGGGFTYGHSSFYGPNVIMKKDVVLITFNYRVGPLGFLSTEDGVISGNMGLKDQVMALKWIKENIHLFGGDSSKITLTGNSAGGASVHLHLMSPMSKGLFNRGISQSGTALMPWVMTENSLEKAKQIAAALNCSTESNIAMKNCLKEKPAKFIVDSVKQFQPWLFNPFTPFGPVVEYETETPFLSQFPIDYLNEGKLQKIPWIISGAVAEGLYPGGELYNSEYLTELEKKWTEISPFLLDFNGTVVKSKQKVVSDKIKEFYLKGNPITENSYEDLIKIISDRLYLSGLQRAVKIHAKKSEAPVYLIWYKYKLQFGVGHKLSGRTDYNFGVSHADDVMIMFETIIRGENSIPLNDDEREMASKLIDFNINTEPIFGKVRMEPMMTDLGSLNYLEINSNDDISMKTINDIGNEAFWYDLIND